MKKAVKRPSAVATKKQRKRNKKDIRDKNRLKHQSELSERRPVRPNLGLSVVVVGGGKGFNIGRSSRVLNFCTWCRRFVKNKDQNGVFVLSHWPRGRSAAMSEVPR